MKKVTIFIALMILFSCSSKKVNTNNECNQINNFFDEVELGMFGSTTRLFLNASFNECGEWGGHKEKMVIYAKGDKEFYLDYQKFKVDCKLIDKNDGSPIQQLELERTLKINQDNKKSISDYFQRMIMSKIGERFPGHVGNSFSIIKSDSTLLIQVYDDKIFDINSYNELLKELKLSGSND